MTLRQVVIAGSMASLLLACTSEYGDPNDAPAGPMSPGSPMSPTGSAGTSSPGPNPGSGGMGGMASPPVVNEMPHPMAGAPLPYTPPQLAGAALPARVWLLTPRQYAKAVESVVGVLPDVSDLDPIPDTGVYPNMSASGLVRVNQAQQYSNKAEAVTTALTDAQLRALVPCGKLEASCKDAFVEATVSKAFRRPPTAEDLSRYGELFDLAAKSGDAALPFRSVLRAVLTSPYLLYRTEIGAPADEQKPTFNLTGHEVATLLSFSILGRPPGEALRAAADRGELSDPSQLREQVQALLREPAASEQFAQFLLEWLRLHHFDGVEKFEDVFPGFADVKDAMLEEARAFLETHGGVQGTLRGLLTAPVTTPTGPLGSFYRSDPSGASASTRVGILSLGAVLAKTGKQYLTSPTLRGLFVREQLLCQHIQLPENFTPPPIEAAEATLAPKTTRELYDAHAKNPACASCHALIDPLGYALESFDGAGRFRTTEVYRSPSFTAPSAGPQPIDTSGTLVGTDVDRAFDSYVDLAEALAESAWVRECVARQAFRYYFGQLEPDRGVPPVIDGTRALQEGGTLGDLVANLLSSPSTLARAR